MDEVLSGGVFSDIYPVTVFQPPDVKSTHVSRASHESWEEK